jgi:enolase
LEGDSGVSLMVDGLSAWEILDSRGRPTLSVQAVLSDGAIGTAQVPAGASTGRHEALELRDGDPLRYGGFGVRRAVAVVEQDIAPEIRGRSAEDPGAIDRHLFELDGTANKSRLGANAMLGVSCALVRALSESRREPLWRTLRSLFHAPDPASIPVPMVNILSGGLHAWHNIEFQDFLVIAHGFEEYAEALHGVVQIHKAARELLEQDRLLITGVADEGGWGPLFPSNRAAAELLTRAIEQAGYRPGEDLSVALDVAASHFFDNGRYCLRSEGRILSSEEMVESLADWTGRFPILSIEDGLDQDDWAGWGVLTRRLGDRLQLVGDDLFTTNAARVRRGIEESAGNAVLVKMNQIGTLTETFEVLRLARSSGFRCVVSARSGETEDSFLADLAVATGAGQIKVGSITRSERLAKYNRLLEIEKFSPLPYYRFPNKAR